MRVGGSDHLLWIDSVQVAYWATTCQGGRMAKKKATKKKAVKKKATKKKAVKKVAKKAKKGGKKR